METSIVIPVIVCLMILVWALAIFAEARRHVRRMKQIDRVIEQCEDISELAEKLTKELEKWDKKKP